MREEQCCEKKHYPLLSFQKQNYYNWRLDPTTIAYNIPSIIEIKGIIVPDYHRVEDIFIKLMQRYDSLRLSFHIQNGALYQKVNDNLKFQIDYADLRDKHIQESDYNNLIVDFIKPFDLSNPPLFRVKLCRIGGNKFLFMLDFHHIISDRESVLIILKDFVKLYFGRQLTQNKLQFTECVELACNEDNKNKIEFWAHELQNRPQKLNLPYDFERSSTKSLEGESIEFNIDSEVKKQLENLARRENCTMFVLMLALYNVLLARISDQSDIIVGTMSAGRNYNESEIPGAFTTPLILRNYPCNDKLFTTFLHEVKDKVLNAFKNITYKYEDVLEQLRIKDPINEDSLYDLSFVYVDDPGSLINMPGISTRNIPIPSKVSKFDINFKATNKSDKIEIKVVYSSRLFLKETIEKIFAQYMPIVRSVLENPEKRISDLTLG